VQRHELEAVFDQSASGYDPQWAKLDPLRDALQLLMAAVFCELPDDARVLCIGVGTGSELIDLAQRHTGWRFTAVEPSVPMLDVCRRKAEANGVADRCVFHAGYLESLPPSGAFDAATSLLVSQFILDRAARSNFFRETGERLRPGGALISADLAADTASPDYERLLEIWSRVMRGADVLPDGLARIRAAYDRDVAVLPPEEVAAIIAAGGFDPPVQFLQTGLIHAWFAQRNAETV
jgi:tRNA (cmo5U34)-methyltransferase